MQEKEPIMVLLCFGKFRHSGNCSASQGLPSDAEQLP